MHCQLTLFFHCGRSVTALNTSVPQAVPTSGIGIWIFLVGAVVHGIPLLPLLSLILPSMSMVLSSLDTNPPFIGARVSFTRVLIYLCTRIGHFHSSSLLMAIYIFHEEGIAKKRRKILLGALDSWEFSRMVHLWNPKRIDNLHQRRHRGNQTKVWGKIRYAFTAHVECISISFFFQSILYIFIFKGYIVHNKLIYYNTRDDHAKTWQIYYYLHKLLHK